MKRFRMNSVVFLFGKSSEDHLKFFFFSVAEQMVWFTWFDINCVGGTPIDIFVTFYPQNPSYARHASTLKLVPFFYISVE